MSLFIIILIALSLSADAFAVAVGAGIVQKHLRQKDAWSMAISFGVFQALMPMIGFEAALFLPEAIKHYNFWIAFVILAYLGAKMAYEGWSGDDGGEKEKDIFGLQSLLILGIATSIDALAVGVSLTATTESILLPAVIIGIVTFILTYIGVYFGKSLGTHMGSRAEIIGGVVLIGIGCKILIEGILSQ